MSLSSRYLIGGFHSVIEHVDLRTVEDLLRVSQRYPERAQFCVIRVSVVVVRRDIQNPFLREAERKPS